VPAVVAPWYVHTGVHAKGLLTLPSPYPSLVVPLPPWCVQPVLNCTEFYSVQQGDSCAHLLWNAANLSQAQFKYLDPGLMVSTQAHPPLARLCLFLCTWESALAAPAAAFPATATATVTVTVTVSVCVPERACGGCVRCYTVFRGCCCVLSLSCLLAAPWRVDMQCQSQYLYTGRQLCINSPVLANITNQVTCCTRYSRHMGVGAVAAKPQNP